MNNIALVYKTGGEYTAEYVNRLADSLQPFGNVTCLTDSPASLKCNQLPLVMDLPGWWSKLELFARFRKGRTVYFDLDTVINGDISPLLHMPGPFAMLSDFYKPERAASGVMAWDGDYFRIFDNFHPSFMAKYRTPAKWGDQGWISDQIGPVMRIQDECPGLVASYKAHSEQQRQAAAIVCYHGQPRPHMTGWKV